jgi:hypothetical protein
MTTWLTMRNVQDRFGVGEQTVRAWVKSGQLRAINVSRLPTANRPLWRFMLADVEAFEAARLTGDPAKPAGRKKKAAPAAAEFCS